jgi:hypothetical protein
MNVPKMSLRIVSLPILLAAQLASAQPSEPLEIDWHIFSHIDGYITDATPYNAPHDRLILGETSILATGQVSDRISFLYEGSLQAKRYRQKAWKNLRWQIRYDLNDRHRLVIGKNHTPINQWNDMFNHGRVFFPTIERPMSLLEFIPMHDHVVRASGYLSEDLHFFYDLTAGSGHEYENELFSHGIKSYTAALGWRSISGDVLRVGVHHNKAHVAGHQHGDMMMPHVSMLPHHQATSMSMMGSESHEMTVPMGLGGQMLTEIAVVAASAHLNVGPLRWVTELAISAGSDETERNTSVYQYIGYQWNAPVTPYVLLDWASLDRGNGTLAGVNSKIGIGFKMTASDNVDVKFELARVRTGTLEVLRADNEARVQVSFTLP